MGKIKVSNGKESFEIDGNDLSSAVKDGYKPTERIIVANSKTKESYEIDPADVEHALADGFSFQDIVKKKSGGGTENGGAFPIKSPSQEEYKFDISTPSFKPEPAKQAAGYATVGDHKRPMLQAEKMAYVPTNAQVEVAKVRNRAAEAQKHLHEELMKNDDVKEAMIRHRRATVAGITAPVPISDQPQTQSSLQASQFAEQKTRPGDLPVSKEDIEQENKDLSERGAAVNMLSKTMEMKPEKKAAIQKSLFLIDYANQLDDSEESAARVKKIEKNAKGIEEGKLGYDPRTGTLYRPTGLIGSAVEGYKQKVKAFEDYDFLKNTSNNSAIRAQLDDERNNRDPDEPVPIPRGKVSEVVGSLAGMPLKPIAGGLIAGAVNPFAGATAGAIIGGRENAKLEYQNTFKKVYYELLDQNPQASDAQKDLFVEQARKQAEQSAEIGAVTGGAMGFVGAKIGLEGIGAEVPAFSPGFKKATIDLVKKSGGEGLLVGAIGSGGEILKNKLAQNIGINRPLDEGAGETLVNNFLMTAGLAAAIKAGKGITSTAYKTILGGMSKVPENVIQENLKEKVQNGEITQKAADETIQRISEHKGIESLIPDDITEEARGKMHEKIQKRNDLEEQLKSTDKALHEPIKEKIKSINEDIISLSKEKQPVEKTESILPKEEAKKAAEYGEELIHEGQLSDQFEGEIKKDAPAFWKNIADEINQGDQESSLQAAKEKYGEAAVDYARELFPQEEPKQPVKPEQPQRITKVEDFDNQLNNILNPKTESNASTVRSDQGQVHQEGQIPEGGENVSRENLQFIESKAPVNGETGQQAGKIDQGKLDKLEGKEIKVGEQKNTAKQYLEKAQTVLNQLFPEFTITPHETSAEYAKNEGRSENSAGVFDPIERRIAFNMELIGKRGAENTIFHEVIHPIVEAAFKNDSGKLETAYQQLLKMKDQAGMDAVFEHMQHYASRGGKIQTVEAVTEFLTHVADGKIDVSKMPEKTWSKFVDVINKIFETLGIDKRIGTPTDLKRLAESIKQSFEKEDAKPVADVLGKKEISGTEKLDALKGDERMKAIRDLIKNSELPEDQIKASLEKAGLSKEEITSLFEKEKETGTGAPPPSDKKSSIHAERPPTELSHRGLQNVANEFSLDDVNTRERKSDVQLRKDAENTVNDWREKGTYAKNIERLVKDAEDGKILTDEQRVIMERHLANVSENLRSLDPKSSEFDTQLKYIKRLKEAGEKTRSEAGAALRIPGGGSRPESTLADYMVREMETSGVDELTDAQKEKVSKEFEEITKAKNALQAKLISLEEEHAKLKAENELLKTKKGTSKKAGEKRDYKAERKEIFSSIQEKLKKARGETSATVLPYAKELIAIAPDVAKLVKNLVEEGIDKLPDIVKNIHGQLKEMIPDIKEKDVHDIIAGEYNEKKETRNDVAAKLQDLRTQAKLMNKLESLEKGEVPKSEEKKIKQNRAIADLRKQIKEHDVTKLSDYKSRTQKQIAELEAKLKNGDFAPQEKKPEIKLDDEAIKLKNKLIELQQEREKRIAQQELAKRPWLSKAGDVVTNILGVPRTLMASMDFSAPLRQGLVATISHPSKSLPALVEMFKQAGSQARFDRWLHDLKESPDYQVMEKSGLYVADPNNLHLSQKEETWMSNMAEKIPLAGRAVKGSERAYVAYLNKLRVDVFQQGAERLKAQGKTIENSPEVYEALASFINHSTGRGSLGKLDDAAQILNTVFFSPRLVASRVNLLNPLYYIKLPKEVRTMALLDMAKTIGFGATIVGLSKLAGAEVQDDPRDPDFGKMKFGDTRYDVFGGFQQYIRVVSQLIGGATKSSTSGKLTDLDSDESRKTRADVITTFLRGKLAPVAGTAWDALAHRTVTGESFHITNPKDLEKKAVDLFIPMIVNDIKDAWKGQGFKSIFTAGIPSAFGVGISTYSSDKSLDLPELIERHAKSSDQDLSKLTAYNDNDEVRPVSKEEKNNYVKTRDKKISDGLTDLYKRGADIIVNGEPETVPFSKLTAQQVTDEITKIKTAATRDAKEELFPVPKSVKHEKDRQDKKLKKYKEEIKND